MEFTNEEIKIIEKAELSSKQAKRLFPLQVVLALSFIMILFLTLFSFINSREFSFISIILIAAAIRPLINREPKYEVLVDLLSSKKLKTKN